jgi:hypothetical protein
MKLLKNLSILGFVWYLGWVILALLAPNDGGQNVHFLVILACLAFLLYAVFHSAIGYIQSNKSKNTLLKITSIVCFVIFALCGLFSILTGVGIVKSDSVDWTIQSSLPGYIIFALPFAIILSIITLIRSSKALKQKK